MRLPRFVPRLLGVALVLIPLLPLRTIYPHARGTNALASPEVWLLGLAIFGTAAWLLAMGLHGRRGERFAGRLLGRFLGLPRGRLLAGFAAILLGLLLLTTAFVFDGRPRLLAAGLLTAPAPPGEGFFAVQQMIVDANGWYSQYPPGHSLLLAAGVVLGAAWVIPVLLSLGTFLLLWAFTREIYGPRTARLTALLAVACPFFWVMGAGFMNHVSALFFLAAFAAALARGLSTERAAWLAAAGAALGGAFLSRPLSAFAVGVPFGLIALHAAWERRQRVPRWWLGPVAMLVAFLPFAGIYLAWNGLTTGDPLTTGYVKLWGSGHELGFHVGPWGESHTPATGLRNELIDLSLLNVFLFEWPLPALLPVGLFFAAGMGTRWDRRLLIGFLAIPIAHFFYWHRDDFLGPRFLYEGLVFILPLTARAILVGWRRLRGLTLQPLGLFRPFDAGTFAAALLLLCLAYAIAYGIPARFLSHAAGWSSMRVDVVAEAEEAGLEGGVIFVTTSWGSRLLAGLRERGVSPSLAEQAYHVVDHCVLQGLLDRARQDGWSPARLDREIESRMARGEMLHSPDLNGDPTLKLRKGGRLTAACAAEIVHDRDGYTLYLPHLLANDPRLRGRWIVAHDMRAENARLLAGYPGRPAYRYRLGRFEPLPAAATAAR